MRFINHSLILSAAICALSAAPASSQELAQGELPCPRVLANASAKEYSLSSSTTTRCFRSKRAAERAGFKASVTDTTIASGITATWNLRLLPRGTTCSELSGPTSIDVQIARNGNDLTATLPNGKTLTGFVLNNSVVFGLNENIACATDTDGVAQSLFSLELSRPGKDSRSFGRALYRFAQNCDRRCSDTYVGIAERN